MIPAEHCGQTNMVDDLSKSNSTPKKITAISLIQNKLSINEDFTKHNCKNISKQKLQLNSQNSTDPAVNSLTKGIQNADNLRFKINITILLHFQEQSKLIN